MFSILFGFLLITIWYVLMAMVRCYNMSKVYSNEAYKEHVKGHNSEPKSFCMADIRC